MSFGYTIDGKSWRKRRLWFAMGLVVIPLSVQLHSRAASVTNMPSDAAPVRDPRIVKLHGFLSKLSCPIAGMAEDFIRAADANQLDWRLLPSIALIESGGGKAYRNNNIFGWNQGKQSFASIKSGIELVAFKLGRSPLYKRHDSLGKLRIYNENEEYAASVLTLMDRVRRGSRVLKRRV